MFNRIRKNRFFLTLVLIKIIFMCLFSSDYKDTLFVPFVHYFTQHWSNPWQYYYEHQLANPFPYPPLMLYILSIFEWISSWFDRVYFIQNFVFKIPLLAADISIFIVLNKFLPNRSKAITAFYFASPIIMYASYIHSQLDLIPTALLLISLYYLMKDKTILASIVFGLAISVKFHVAAALPLILIFLWKKRGKPLFFLLPVAVLYALFVLPFLSEGFIHYVFQNKEQMQIFNVIFPVSGLHIYLAVMLVILIYIRFVFYKKINNDLFFSYAGLLFSAFLLFVPPMPGWYLWIVPFLYIYFINAYPLNHERIFILDAILSASYLLYFGFFHISPLHDVLILGHPVQLKLPDNHLMNLSFTILTSCLLAVVYYLYNHGVRSNSIYKKAHQSFAIGIGGDSGAGKSTLLRELKMLLNHKRVLELEGDGDHKWERGDSNWNEYTHLNPKANHLHRQSEHLLLLKLGEPIERSAYDHDTGKFTSSVKQKPSDFIVLSGLHPFYLPKMRKTIDLKIYLETEENLRWHWKIVRDMKKRGYSREQVIAQIQARMADAQKYIHPQKAHADLIISYFTEEEFEIGDEHQSPKLLIKFTLDSNIDLDPLIIELMRSGVTHYEHEFSDDLKNQYFIIREAVNHLSIEAMVDRLIPNKEEIISGDAAWLTGHDGFVQLIMLIMIAEKMKEDPV